jgi:hypothetical protein
LDDSKLFNLDSHGSRSFSVIALNTHRLHEQDTKRLSSTIQYIHCIVKRDC